MCLLRVKQKEKGTLDMKTVWGAKSGALVLALAILRAFQGTVGKSLMLSGSQFVHAVSEENEIRMANFFFKGHMFLKYL